MRPIGMVVEDLFGRLYRVNAYTCGTVFINKIENGRISGKIKAPWFFNTFYKPREDLRYSLYEGLKEKH